ncbi:MAG: sugar O-acetyltransferase, partial [bacterium]|nr:sugar O-acetyltransferase [bacterium]
MESECQISEYEKCMAGDIYKCHEPVFLEFKRKTRELLLKYNALAYDQKKEKYEILKQMFGKVGENVTVANPFVCDYGRNIEIGDNVSINMNCTFIDCNKITIGSNIMIAPNVQLYTATHPIELDERIHTEDKEHNIPYHCDTYALPITIEDGVWIGGGVIVLPGITIGQGSVIGAG